MLKRAGLVLISTLASLSAAFVLAHYSGYMVPSSSRALKQTGLTTTLDGKHFTGVVYSFYAYFRPKQITFYLAGRLQGTEIHWYPNGMRELERSFDKGIPDGIHQGWHENGRMRFYRTYRDGHADGEQWAWYQDGQVWEYNRYASGKELTHKTWTFDGKPFHNYVFQGSEKIGIQGEDFCKILLR